MTIKVFQVDPSPRLAPYTWERAAIAAAGGQLILGDCKTAEEVVAQAADAEIMLVSWSPLITPAMMDRLPRVRLLCRWGVGYDQFDPDAASARGIAVVNTPTYCGDEVAEHTIALLFASARRIVWAHERIRTGFYTPAPYPIRRLAGRTLGIIGCGRIGSKVAARARGLGLEVIAYDRYRSDDELLAIGVTPRGFDEVLAESDYLTLHVPLDAGTRHLIDAGALAKIRPTTMLINTSRGPVIDQVALVEALAVGRLAAAGLDVYEEEPLPADHPLRSLEHVVLTPHAAAWSEDSIEGLRQEMVDNITTVISTGWSPKIVNPEVRATLRPRA